jgi:hypothetical protein
VSGPAATVQLADGACACCAIIMPGAVESADHTGRYARTRRSDSSYAIAPRSGTTPRP